MKDSFFIASIALALFTVGGLLIRRRGRRKDKPIYLTGKTWKVKQAAAQWIGRR
jgi:hypothetical protein